MTGGNPSTYWTSEVGKNVLRNADNRWRKKLNKYPLVKANGKDFDLQVNKQTKFEKAYGKFAAFMAKKNAANVANQLSVEVACCRLSLLYGRLDPKAQVIVSDQDAGIMGLSSNKISVAAAIARAKISLKLYGYVLASGPVRDYQMCLKNVLEAINNNQLNSVPDESCEVVY